MEERQQAEKETPSGGGKSKEKKAGESLKEEKETNCTGGKKPKTSKKEKHEKGRT